MYTNLRKLRESLDMSQKDFGATIGITKTTYNNYELGVREPNSDFWNAIADKYNVTVDYLLGRCDNPQGFYTKSSLPDPPDASEQEMIEGYRELDAHGKKMVDFVLSEELARMAAGDIDVVDPHLTVEARQRRRERLIHNMGAELQKIAQMFEEIKFSSNVQEQTGDNAIYLQRPYDTVAASEGSGAWLDGRGWDNVKVSLNDLTRKADLVLKVQGRSMEPEYFDGDQVLVRAQPDILDGEIGIFTIDGEGFLKQKAADRLISLNPDVPDIYVHELQDCRCVGKVIGKLDPAWIVEE